MNNPFLVGSKVYLRPMEREDALTVQPWVNDAEIRRYGRMYVPMSLRSEQQFLDNLNQSNQDIIGMIVRRDVDQPIGMTGLHEINHRIRHCSFGIILGEKDTWGMGFGTEATELIVGYAFHTLNLHRVSLQVYDFNTRAIRVYERIGFQQEGILRDGHFVEGKYCDVVCMSILEYEWQARP